MHAQRFMRGAVRAHHADGPETAAATLQPEAPARDRRYLPRDAPCLKRRLNVHVHQRGRSLNGVLMAANGEPPIIENKPARCFASLKGNTKPAAVHRRTLTCTSRKPGAGNQVPETRCSKSHSQLKIYRLSIQIAFVRSAKDLGQLNAWSTATRRHRASDRASVSVRIPNSHLATSCHQRSHGACPAPQIHARRRRPLPENPIQERLSPFRSHNS